MKIKHLLPIFSIALLCLSCSNDKPLFKAYVVQKAGLKNMSFEPNMNFEIVIDSAYQYFSREDYNVAFGGTISKGETIYKTNNYEMKVILRTYSLLDREEYEFVLRTFSNDFKIIDSYVMASTKKDLACDGVINQDLVITTSCADGTVRTATVDEYGKFIEQ